MGILRANQNNMAGFCKQKIKQYRQFWGTGQPFHEGVSHNNLSVKRHMVGRKYMRPYAADRVFTSFVAQRPVICCAYWCTKRFVKSGETKF